MGMPLPALVLRSHFTISRPFSSPSPMSVMTKLNGVASSAFCARSMLVTAVKSQPASRAA